VQPNLDGRLRQAEAARHLDLAEVLRVAQAEHSLIAVSQRAERLLDGQAGGRAGEVVLLAIGAWSDQLAVAALRLAAEQPAGLVAGDLQQPGQRLLG
jgi:hypothetical protein